MKKTISLVLALCLALALTAGPAYASSSSLSSAQQTVQALGIMTGDENGSLNLSGNVTRAQLAKMMIGASKYKDSISATAKSSPFKDVKYTHWAASYVQAVAKEGWMTGYSDGTFRPDANVKLEEAVSAVLKLLGYTSSSDFSGSYPEAQLAKYNALGLNVNITKTQGQTLSRQDCMYLFYNLLSTKSKSGSYYATTLGYTVNSSGEVDYSSLVMANMKGPFIVEDSAWSSTLPFTSSTITVYKNGSASSLSAVSTYDVYYYNTGMKSVWVYSNRVTGAYTAASPSTAAPSSVTVAGKAYSVTAASASYALSDVGSYGIGDTVTLLLGMNGDVVGVASSSLVSSAKYGIVASTGTKTYADSSGNNHTASVVIVSCTDGNSYQYDYTGSSLNAGDLVKISFTSGTASVNPVSSGSITGTVNSSATVLGSYSFASDVQIMDSTINGSFCITYPARLAGLNISSSDVRYYALDSSGKISTLILNDVTGDAYKYGILTDATNTGTDFGVSGSYKFIVDGTSGAYSSASKSFGASTGPAQIELSGNSILSMTSLTRVTFTSLTSSSGTASDGTTYALGSGASVYLYKSGTYSLTSIAAVNTGSYSLSGYYDQSISSGGRIRIIVAYAN